MKKIQLRDSVESTLIGKGTVLDGEITFEGTIYLNGTISGTIRSQSGSVVIGETADVSADIHVDEAVIYGKVQGSVIATRKIEVHSPANVSGDIKAPEIAIGAGVLFSGKCIMDVNQAVSAESDKSLENQPLTEHFEGNSDPKNL